MFVARIKLDVGYLVVVILAQDLFELRDLGKILANLVQLQCYICCYNRIFGQRVTFTSFWTFKSSSSAFHEIKSAATCL